MAGTEDFEHKGRDAFVTLLAEVADGEAAIEASRDLEALVKVINGVALAKNGKAKGRIRFDLVIEINAKGDVTLDYDVDVKRPKMPRSSGRMWIGTGGGLTARHPKQVEIPGTERRPPRLVGPPAAPPRVITRPAAPAATNAGDAGEEGTEP